MGGGISCTKIYPEIVLARGYVAMSKADIDIIHVVIVSGLDDLNLLRMLHEVGAKSQDSHGETSGRHTYKGKTPGRICLRSLNHRIYFIDQFDMKVLNRTMIWVIHLSLDPIKKS